MRAMVPRLGGAARAAGCRGSNTAGAQGIPPVVVRRGGERWRGRRAYDPVRASSREGRPALYRQRQQRGTDERALLIVPPPPGRRPPDGSGQHVGAQRCPQVKEDDVASGATP